MLAPEVRALLGKEWRQLVRSRAAMASALLLPTVLLVLIPCLQMVGLSKAPVQQLPEGFTLPPALAHLDLKGNPRALMAVLLPLFVVLGGLVVPSVTAVHTLIAEREGRTLELLVALPVRVGQILLAKMLALLALAVPVTFVLFAVTATVALLTGTTSLPHVLALWVLLVGALVMSVCGTLLISLLARDFRTANNLTGLLIVPPMLLTVGLALLVPSRVLAALLAAGALLVLAGLALAVALRVVTFERLLR